MVKVTHSTKRPIQSTDWHKRLCAQMLLLLAVIAFGILLNLRHDAGALFPLTRPAVFVVLIVSFLVARRYLAPRLGTTLHKSAMFGLGAATLTFLYFAGFYSIFETGQRISNGYITTMAESVDAMAEIATRVLTGTFDPLDFAVGAALAYSAGFFAELFQRMWGDPIRAPRV